MRFKTLMLATTLACAAATSGAIAGPRGDMPSPEQRAVHLQKSLQLNDEQRQKVQLILQQSSQQRSALEKKYTIAERDQFRDEARKLHDTQQKQIDALLTPAQREAHAAQRSHRHHMGAHKHGMKHKGDCPPPPAAKAS